MNPSTPKTDLPPSTQLRKAVFGGSHILFVALLGLLTAGPISRAANFTSDGDTATKFGVYEIVLTGNGEVANPGDTIATVNFVPPTGEKTRRPSTPFSTATIRGGRAFMSAKSANGNGPRVATRTRG